MLATIEKICDFLGLECTERYIKQNITVMYGNVDFIERLEAFNKKLKLMPIEIGTTTIGINNEMQITFDFFADLATIYTIKICRFF